MLERQDGGGDEDGNLFAIGDRLEGSADGYLCLAEADVAADETVHRLSELHVVLDVVGGFELVGGVFVDERCLEFLLQVAVG